MDQKLFIWLQNMSKCVEGKKGFRESRLTGMNLEVAILIHKRKQPIAEQSNSLQTICLKTLTSYANARQQVRSYSAYFCNVSMGKATRTSGCSILQ